MNTNTAVVKPEVTHLDDIFEDISSGQLRIPGFQRPFVWEPSDMLDLFESLYNGYPIGSLLLWETSEKLKSGQKVGAIKIPDANNGLVTYVLDGQQRLATLYSGLKLAKDFPLTKKQEDWRWWIWFDLKNDNFIHVKTEKPEPWLFPVRAIYQTMDFLDQARHIEEKYKEDASVFIEKAERLSQKIRSYKIAIIRVRGSSLTHAVDIFSRLNRKGKKITPDQMVSALAYSDNGKSLDEYIDEILESLTDYHFNNINRMTLFRAIMAAADTKVHRSDWENIAKKISPDNLSVAAQNARKALQTAAGFLNKEIGLPGDKLLPYSNQFLLLSEFFRHCPKPKPAQRKILKKWFWVSSLSDWLTSINTTQLNQALEEMQQFAEDESFQLKLMSGKPVVQAFPEQFSSLKSSRLRAFFIFMLTKRPLELSSGEPIDSYKILSENGKNAFAKIFPSLKTPLSSSPANRLLLERIPGESIRKRLSSIPEAKQEQILDSHGIPTEAYEALEKNDAETFIKVRTQHLMEIEKKFLQSLDLGIT
jgi:hypothetical protein